MENGSLFMKACVLAAGVSLALAGCGGSNDDDRSVERLVRTYLTANQVVPNSTATGSGMATLTFHDNDTIRVQLSTTGLTGVRKAEIRLGEAGQDGPVLFTVYDSTTDPAFPATWDTTLGQMDFQPQGDVDTVSEAIDRIMADRAFIQVTTATHPAGAIRGQLGESLELNALLAGGNEVPPVETTATGTARIEFDNMLTRAEVTLTHESMDNETMARLHVGVPGVNGPVVVPLYNRANDGELPREYKVQIDATDLTPAGGITTWEQFVRAVLDGRIYANVHTTDHPAGEIRGQLLLVRGS